MKGGSGIFFFAPSLPSLVVCEGVLERNNRITSHTLGYENNSPPPPKKELGLEVGF